MTDVKVLSSNLRYHLWALASLHRSWRSGGFVFRFSIKWEFCVVDSLSHSSMWILVSEEPSACSVGRGMVPLPVLSAPLPIRWPQVHMAHSSVMLTLNLSVWRRGSHLPTHHPVQGTESPPQMGRKEAKSKECNGLWVQGLIWFQTDFELH